MQDMVINGTGDSRYLKSVSNFLSLYPTYEDFARALIAGTLPFDLNGVNENGIGQLGTPLNKATLLKDATAAMFGLGTGGTPNLAFEVLGEYFKHAWWVQHNSGYYGLVQSQHSHNTVNINNGDTRTVTYYDSVSINSSTGAITGSGSHTVTASYNGYTSFQALLGKYVQGSALNGLDSAAYRDNWYYIPESVTIRREADTEFAIYSVYIDGYITDLMSIYYPTNTIEYLTSDDPNAYTKFGTVNGDYYRYAGIPFEHFFYSKRIAYSGTGQAQTLEFEANPLMVVVQSTTGSQWLAAIQGVARGFGSTAADVTWAANKVTISGTVITAGTQYRAAVFYL